MAIFQETTTVKDSYLFQKMDANGVITARILDVIRSGKVITESDIEEQLIQVRKTRISPLADHVIAAFQRGEIVLVYSETTKIVPAIPFIVVNIGGKSKAYIFTNAYGSYAVPKRASQAEKVFNIGMKDMYALMEGAYITCEYYKNPQLFSRNIGLMKTCVSVYTSMMLRILNKEHALSLSPNEFNQVSYCIARYFLENVWEISSNEMSHAYAIGTILNANRMDYVQSQDDWEIAEVKSLESLIEYLKDHFPRLRTLSIRFFVEHYMNMYRATVALGLECLPYFLFAITSSMLGSFVVNQPIIYEILKNTKGINYFYPELGKFL